MLILIAANAILCIDHILVLISAVYYCSACGIHTFGHTLRGLIYSSKRRMRENVPVFRGAVFRGAATVCCLFFSLAIACHVYFSFLGGGYGPRLCFVVVTCCFVFCLHFKPYSRTNNSRAIEPSVLALTAVACGFLGSTCRANLGVLLSLKRAP